MTVMTSPAFMLLIAFLAFRTGRGQCKPVVSSVREGTGNFVIRLIDWGDTIIAKSFQARSRVAVSFFLLRNVTKISPKVFFIEMVWPDSVIR